MLRLPEIKLSIEQEETEIKKLICKKLRIEQQELIDYRIFKQSIDARKKDKIHFVYTVDVRVKDEKRILQRNRDIIPTPDLEYHYVIKGSEVLRHRPVVIGTGPAGLFSGLVLAQMGYKPILLERGRSVEERTLDVEVFWKTGKLDPESNVQFGEGGAGTFSDGKLTTLIKNIRCRKVLEELVEAGAPPEIMYKNKPHVGTDILKQVVKNIRNKIIALGGEVRFESKITDISIDQNRICGVVVNGQEKIETNVVLLAVGHSARDTFQMLYDQGVPMSPKAFSIGVRIEHPQSVINESQYGIYADDPKLGAADYKLSHHCENGRSAYTFCMCPGGFVVAAASEEGRVVTNGMSEYARDQRNANSALLVGVTPEDFGDQHPLAGVAFQRKWEEMAYKAGGGAYLAPAQLVGDFLANRPSTGPGEIQPSYTPGVVWTQLGQCLPDYVIDTMKESILIFDKKLKGFAHPEAVMTGIETRSSSPVRIHRNECGESSIKGLYPVGEGAGYAGGIVSAAVDGITAAEAVAKRYR